MFAIVQIAGKQYKVQENDVLEVNRLKEKKGAKLEIKEVLLLVNDKGEVKVGKPFLEDHKVEAEVLEEVKGEKVISFKYKPKKGYHRKKGFRPIFTKILIKKIQ